MGNGTVSETLSGNVSEDFGTFLLLRNFAAFHRIVLKAVFADTKKHADLSAVCFHGTLHTEACGDLKGSSKLFHRMHL